MTSTAQVAKDQNLYLVQLISELDKIINEMFWFVLSSFMPHTHNKVLVLGQMFEA